MTIVVLAECADSPVPVKHKAIWVKVLFFKNWLLVASSVDFHVPLNEFQRYLTDETDASPDHHRGWKIAAAHDSFVGHFSIAGGDSVGCGVIER